MRHNKPLSQCCSCDMRDSGASKACLNVDTQTLFLIKTSSSDNATTPTRKQIGLQHQFQSRNGSPQQHRTTWLDLGKDAGQQTRTGSISLEQRPQITSRTNAGIRKRPGKFWEATTKDMAFYRLDAETGRRSRGRTHRVIAGKTSRTAVEHPRRERQPSRRSFDMALLQEVSEVVF